MCGRGSGTVRQATRPQPDRQIRADSALRHARAHPEGTGDLLEPRIDSVIERPHSNPTITKLGENRLDLKRRAAQTKQMIDDDHVARTNRLQESLKLHPSLPVQPTDNLIGIDPIRSDTGTLQSRVLQGSMHVLLVRA